MKTTIKISKVFGILCLLQLSVTEVQGQQSIPPSLAPGWSYPRVENGNSIVSRDALGGIKKEALLTKNQQKTLLSMPAYDMASDLNKVSEKFVVAPTNAYVAEELEGWEHAARACSNYSLTPGDEGLWRLPTQRELMLIGIFYEQLTDCHLGFPPYSADAYWSGTETKNQYFPDVMMFTIYFRQGIVTHAALIKEFGSARVRCVKAIY